MSVFDRRHSASSDTLMPIDPAIGRCDRSDKYRANESRGGTQGSTLPLPVLYQPTTWQIKPINRTNPDRFRKGCETLQA